MVPAFVNARAGTARQARAALEQTGQFDVHAIEPNVLDRELRTCIDATHPARIVVAGGDGTIATAAAVLSGDATAPALAILPGGTLNHFARDHHIPTTLDDAAHVALTGVPVSADVAFAGERLFLNTSAVGAYVTYVRVRDRFERYVGYRLASFAAAFRLLFTMRSVRVTLEVEGVERHYDTPLVFIGVGERELRAPSLGSRVERGQRCLHVLVVRERKAARLLAVGLAAVTRGIQWIAQTPEVDSFLTDRCTIGRVATAEERRARPRAYDRGPRVAVDGEIVHMQAPIEYRIVRDALTIIAPSEG